MGLLTNPNPQNHIYSLKLCLHGHEWMYFCSAEQRSSASSPFLFCIKSSKWVSGLYLYKILKTLKLPHLVGLIKYQFVGFQGAPKTDGQDSQRFCKENKKHVSKYTCYIIVCVLFSDWTCFFLGASASITLSGPLRSLNLPQSLLRQQLHPSDTRPRPSNSKDAPRIRNLENVGLLHPLWGRWKGTSFPFLWPNVCLWRHDLIGPDS